MLHLVPRLQDTPLFGLRARIGAVVVVGIALLATWMAHASSERLTDTYRDAARAQLEAIAATWADGISAEDLDDPSRLQRRVERIKTSVPELHKIALTWDDSGGNIFLVQAGHEHDPNGVKRDVTTSRALSISPSAHTRTAIGETRFREMRGADGVHYAELDRRLGAELSDATPAALELHYDLKAMDASLHDDKWDLIMVALWAALILGAVLIVLLGRVVVRPLDRIRATTNALRDGDHGARLAWSRSDEIGHLARDFDRMADDLLEAFKDSLTGLLNHRAFQERLGVELARARRDGRNVSVVALDVDAFKAINDANGHAAGDDALRMMANAIGQQLRPGDLCGRVGGDEFMVALVDSDAATAAEIAERLRRDVAAASHRAELPLTLSAGIATFPEHAETQDALLALADGAMYWSKSTGKNRVSVYSPDREQALSPADAAERNLRAGLVNTVHALARAVDAKDGYTHSHSQRVASYAESLGRRLGCSADELDRLRTAGVLHDVGKIGISDAVLLKPGRLTDEEMAEMRRHSELGRDIVAGAGLEEVARWVLHLHERFDGGGYPAGLAGEEIPLASRILHCADALEAMTSSRVYRPALPVERALDQLERGIGTQFDPVVAAALVDLVRSGELRIEGDACAELSAV